MTPRRFSFLLGASFIVALSVLGAIPAWTQDTVLKTQAFGTLTRPVALFDHDTHNEKAGLDDCAICHHVYRNGKLVAGESSEDKACSDCHTLQGQGRQPGLRVAYHTACAGCHTTKAKGPLACGQCHRR